MESHEFIILGAGPAGLQTAFYLDRAGVDCLVLEGGSAPGTFFTRFPRHRKLISVNKVHTGYDDPKRNMRWDWNSLLSDQPELLLGKYTDEFFPNADVFVKYLGDYARETGLAIRYETQISNVTRDATSGNFVLTDSKGNTYEAKYLVVATGVSRAFVPDIPGIELAVNYTDVSIDPKAFQNRHVLIVGKANSAFETADNLVGSAAVVHLVSPNPIKFAWQTHFVGHLRAVNNNVLDMYQLKVQFAVLNANVERFEKRGDKIGVHFAYTMAHGEREVRYYDDVIIATGFRFDGSIFDKTCAPRLAINDRFPAQTSEFESSNVPNMYFVGTINQVRDFKKSSSGFVHGFRYNADALVRILLHKHGGRRLPRSTTARSAEALAEAVLASVNRTSALWQQFGFFCDAIDVDAEGGAEVFEALPLAYVHEKLLGGKDHYYTVSLEYGVHAAGFDPFMVVRPPTADVSRAAQSNFLHPVVRRFHRGKMVAEHHVMEDLDAEWAQDTHRRPLVEFFRRNLDVELTDTGEPAVIAAAIDPGAVRPRQSPSVLPPK